MRDWIDIGSSPPAEPCAQLGSNDYYERARKECKVYIALLRRVLGDEPPGARLSIKSHAHDFGNYLSVACSFDDAEQAAVDYAFRCEAGGPEYWDEQARKELAEQSPPQPRKEMIE